MAGYFRDLRPYVSHCRFPDCTHTHEEPCAVKDAVADGWIDARRYESYVQIQSGDDEPTAIEVGRSVAGDFRHGCKMRASTRFAASIRLARLPPLSKLKSSGTGGLSNSATALLADAISAESDGEAACAYRRRITFAVFMLAGIVAANAPAAEYYVAPTGGSDSNPGSVGSPFATFGKAIGLAQRQATRSTRAAALTISARSSPSSEEPAPRTIPIKLFAYPGETPILDFAGQADADCTIAASSYRATPNWWHIKGLTIQTRGRQRLQLRGDHGVFEQIVTRFNRDSGFQFGRHRVVQHLV